MTDIQFRKSPTGEKSNLSEEQWRFLYDKENEELFKNWEVAAAFKYATEGKPVAELSGKEFQKAEGESVINNVLAYYTDIFDNRVFREGIGDVILDKKGIKDSIAHGLSREKAVAFAAVPKIIEKGIVFDRQENWKGRKYDTCVLIAPITIAGKKYAEEVVLRQNTKTNKFYLHEVELNEKLLELFKTPTERSSPKSYLIITKHLEEVKNCSVEIGDNFEPKSDYIQTIIEKHIMANKNNTLSSVQSDAQRFADSLNEFFVEHKDSPDAEPDLYSANFNPGLLEIPVDENGFTEAGAWFELFMNLKDGLSFSISKINPDNTTDFNYQEKLSDYGKQIFEAAKPLMKERLRAEIEKGKQFDSIINGKDGGMRAFYAASEYAAHLNKEKNMENEAVNVSDEEINKLTNVIKNKTYMTVQNPELKEVVFNYGDFGNLTTLKSEGGNGIIHIIQRRAEIDKLSANDISSLLIKIFELSKTTKPDKYDSTRTRAFIEKDGIKVILQKNWNGTDKNWLVSGYEIIGDNKKLTLEAAENIKTVNALYGYKPEHSRLRIQVGAVIASIQTVRQKQLRVKTEKNKIFVENTKKQISTKNAKTVYDKAILNQPLNLVSDSLLKTAYTSSVYANYILTNFSDSELLLKAKNLRLIELSGNKELIEKYKNELHFRGYSFENNITRNFAEVFFSQNYYS